MRENLGRVLVETQLLTSYRRLILCLTAAVSTILLPLLSIVRADNSTGSSGFSVRKEDAAITEAIEDFERYRDKKAWEKAFASIGKALDAKHDRLMPGQSEGFFIPVRQKFRDELLSLPADGREAYRLFNDAKATNLLRDLTNADSDTDRDSFVPGDDDTSLKNFVDLYFITSVGDQAADRLGDSLFEKGDFAEAEDCWRLILESYPDTALSPALLQTKRAIALESAGKWEQFQAIRELITTRFPGQKIRIAGQDVVAVDFVNHIASLHSAESAAPTTSVASPQDAVGSTLTTCQSPEKSVALPASDTPVWQCPLLDEQTMAQLQQQMNNSGWGRMTDDFANVVPATAVDSERMYVNWFGGCFAIDLKTGKMLWRTESLVDLPQRLQQMVMQGQWDGGQMYAVAVAGDRVLFVGRSVGVQNSQPLMTHMLCVNGKTGKTLWKSDKSSLSDWSFSGTPLIHGDVAYAVAHASSSQEFNLLSIGLAKGDLQATLPLGTPTLGTNMRGMQVAPTPILLEHDDKVYVLTNNGAVLATDPKAGRVLWAYTYATHIEQQQTFWYNNTAKIAPVAAGAMLLDSGTLFIKEYKGEQIFALDLAGPSLKWERPVDNTVTLAAADARCIYLVGSEADCIDRESHDMQWSAKLSTDTGYIRPIISGGEIYVFGQRGIHQLNTQSGDAGPMFRGFDRESVGGGLWQLPDELITVSNLAVTAYPTGPAVKP